jgi:hypothetical protein
LFEEIWKYGTDVKERIAFIEEGVDLGEIEVIPRAVRAGELYLDTLKKGQKDIFPYDDECFSSSA